MSSRSELIIACISSCLLPSALLVELCWAFPFNCYQVRLISDVHGLDITLDLLSSPPPQEIEFSNELSAGTPTKGRGGKAEVPPPLSGSENIEVVAAQEAEQVAARANVDIVERENDCDTMLDEGDSKTVTPPVSAESFFFMVPTLPKV